MHKILDKIFKGKTDKTTVAKQVETIEELLLTARNIITFMKLPT